MPSEVEKGAVVDHTTIRSGNLYSVPDTTRRRVLDVHVFADEISHL